MKIFYSLLISLYFFNLATSFGQSENCSAATPIAVTATCASPTNGTTGLTQNLPGCVGNADDDVWYQFVATATSHQINVVPSASMDPVVQLFSGGCTILATISCMDANLTGGNETINATGLTIGNTYKIRIYHYGAGSGSGTFTICVTNPPPAPSNDNCTGATVLTVNTNCINTPSTTVGATQSAVGCSGNADDDVWFSFTATNTTATITVDPSLNMDAVVEFFSGSCASLNSIQCEDAGFNNGDEIINAIGLIPGNTYFIRVYDFFGGGGFPFDICITGSGTSAIPTNDEPCNAIALAPVTASCNFLQFSTIGATASMGAPTPSACVGGSGAQIGGFSAGSHDIWFSVVAPANGQITITMEPNAAHINDGVMVLYSGTCGALTQVTCSDDNNYPGGVHDFKPYISETGLTPGATYFIRYWGFGTNAGDFGFCVSSPINDDCSNALVICDLNGYSASTSAAYTSDRPSNMRANAEVNDPPTYTYTPGTNTGGIFGQGGPWGTGAPLFDVQINNNSWIKFTASNTTAILNVAIGTCWVGNYPSGGIQMQIFSGTNCTNFTPVSNFQEGSSNFTITANSLTIGNDYYLMIDGYAGDICNYTITANSGVQFADIIALQPAICFGDSTILQGPALATSYAWMPGGETTQNITVNPSTTTTYTLTAEGACGNKQIFTKTITVNPFPTAAVMANDTICTNEILALNGNPAGGVAPYTHTWTGTGSPFLNNAGTVNPTFTPTVAGNYTLIYQVSDPIGCSVQDTMNLLVNATPTINILGNTSLCAGNIDTLTATGGGTYSWSTGSNSDTTIISPTNTATYTVVVTGTNGCIDSTTQTVTVNSSPTASISPSSTVICQGNPVTLTASGGGTYLWNDGTTTMPVITDTPTSDSTYFVTITNANGCFDTISVTIQVVSNPTATINGVDTICAGGTTVLTATGGGTYVWNDNSTLDSLVVSPATTTTYTVTVDLGGCTDMTTYTVVVNQLPNVIATGNGSICIGESDTLTATGALTYSWSTGSLFDTTIVSPINNPTLYTVIGTDINGCVNTFNINVTVNQLPTINITPVNPICEGNTVTLIASGGLTYIWNTTQITTSINITPINTTSYTVIGIDVNGCRDSAQTTVTVLLQPTANITGSNIVCNGESITLTGDGGGSYLWNTSDTTQSITITPSDTAIYTLTVNINGCTDDTTFTVAVTPLPSISAFNDTTILLGQSATIFAQGNAPYSWTPVENLSCTDCANPTATPRETTTYCVSITENNCPNTACVTVFVDETCGDLYVPNAFSPNNDGENDCLKVYSNCLETVLFRVYSRWGALIYESDEVGACWDGTNNGSDLNTGTYVYTVAATLIDGQNVELKGNVTLFK